MLPLWPPGVDLQVLDTSGLPITERADCDRVRDSEHESNQGATAEGGTQEPAIALNNPGLRGDYDYFREIVFQIMRWSYNPLISDVNLTLKPGL
jgi:hypothetical protein